MSTDTENVEIDWASISDAEVAEMSAPPSEGQSANNENSESTGVDPAVEEEPTEELDEEGNPSEVTGGAGSEEEPTSEDDEAVGDREPEDAETAPLTPDDSSESEATGDDQSSEPGEEEETGEEAEPERSDYQALYEELMAPFKAAGREIVLDDPKQIRRLAQMGVDYNQKMQHLKPYMKVLRTLERAELLDPDRINFLIDLDSKNPAAIKKLLEDSSIDPLELGREDNAEPYSPTDHSVSDTEMGVRDAFEAIETSDHFDRTVTVLTKEWDGKSKEALAGNPNLIGLMHSHISDGTYDQVWGEVVKLRMLGQLVGLSDLAAYDQTGQAMANDGKLADPQPVKATSSEPSTPQASAQENGSKPKGGNKTAALKRAASPTKGGASGGRGKLKAPNFLDMTDQEIEEYDLKQLSKFK
jgi:hypothetical protein